MRALSFGSLAGEALWAPAEGRPRPANLSRLIRMVGSVAPQASYGDGIRNLLQKEARCGAGLSELPAGPGI